MSDLISRQAAIDAVKKLRDDCVKYYGKKPCKGYWELTVAMSVIKTVPSVQPERKKGKWIYAEDEYGIDGYHCDKCGFFVPWDYTHKFINYIEDYHFCPACGARMEG